MTKQSPSYPRLHNDSSGELSREVESTYQSLGDLCEDFQAATGWPLKYLQAECADHGPDPLWSAPVNPGVGTAPGYLTIGAAGGRNSGRAALENAAELAGSIAALVDELGATRRALWQREAELATAVPVVSQGPDTVQLATRLEAVLRGGAEAVGCCAAGLYLLDDATTQLKLRSCWGLPSTRLSEPPRPLQGAIADLEALTGHAVVLEDRTLHNYWKPPENHAAAVCVPVSTPTSLLGTLWMFADAPRDFSDVETNQIEIIAGRLAADLEREVLLAETLSVGDLRQQVDEAIWREQSSRALPSPQIEGWDIAGWSRQTEVIGGGLLDWGSSPGGEFWFTVGGALERGLEAALIAASARAAIRSHAEYVDQPDLLLTRTGNTLWSNSAGDRFAAVCHGRLTDNAPKLQLAIAGQASVLHLAAGHWQSHSESTIPLGVQPESQYEARRLTLEPGETLVVYVNEFEAAEDPSSEELSLAEMLLAKRDISASTLAALVGEHLATDGAETSERGLSVLVLRRPSGSI